MKFLNKIIALFFLCTFLFVSQISIAQLDSDKDNFLITVQKTADGIKLKCEQGCAWKKLSFSLDEKTSQAVNAFGMMDKLNTIENKDKNLMDFQFDIKSTKKGIALKGLKGTIWTELNFNLRENTSQIFNKFGTIN